MHVANQNRNSFEESDKLTVDVNSLKMMLEGGNIEFNEDSEEEEDDSDILKMKPVPRPKQQKSSNRKLDEDYIPAKHLLQPRRQTEPHTQTKLSISKTTGSNFKPELNGHAVQHPISNGTLEDEVSSLSRTRANAIDKRSSPILRSKAQKTKPNPSVEERKELEKAPLRHSAKSPEPSRDTKKKELRNSASIQVEDAEVRRSGSWKRYKQFSGDQALGIFYHNRRSQLIDSEALDEAERKLQERGSSVERSSSPHSPLSRPRDSRGVSPHPRSPLAIRGSGIFERGMAEREKGLEVVSESSAGAPVTEETEDDLEVSGYFSSFCCYYVTCRELALTLLPLLSSLLLPSPPLPSPPLPSPPLPSPPLPSPPLSPPLPSLLSSPLLSSPLLSSPSVVHFHFQNSSEMSSLQKQLLQKRRTSRVELKQKKLLAMMEEETVIDDTPKPAKLIQLRKLEVRLQ